MRLSDLRKKLDTYNRIEISKKALLHNADFFKNKTGFQIIPVLKSNAYGHGLALVAEALDQTDFPFLAVDGYFEALRLRRVNKIPILIMGMIKPGDIKKIKTKNTAFVVQDKATIQAFGALNKKVDIHLEINTGMNRYGIRPDELSSYLSLIRTFPKLNLDGVMTHLADPDGKDGENIVKSTDLFDKSVDMIMSGGFNPRFIHIGQSASSIRLKSKHANSTRIGLALYGINPFEPDHKLHEEYKNNLQPALKLVSTISRVNSLKAGEKIGYNYTFTAKTAMTVGVLPLGYYEGIDHRLSNKGLVKYGRDFLPIVGKVCMNHVMIDLKQSSAKVGDEVVVFSDSPADLNSFNSISTTHGLFVYSMLVGLSADLRRVLV